MIRTDDKFAIWGASGSGKTTLGMDLLKQVRDKVQLAIIDPYAKSGHRTAAEAAQALYRGDEQAILRNSNPDQAIPFIYAAYGASSVDKPVFLVCDEAPDYLNREGDNLKRVFTQGRHRGLGIMIMGQRPSMVRTTYRTQCSNSRWLRLTDHADIAIAKQVIGPEKANLLPNFAPGENIQHPPKSE